MKPHLTNNSIGSARRWSKLLSLAAVGVVAFSLLSNLGAVRPDGKGKPEKPDKPGNGGGGDSAGILAKARFNPDQSIVGDGISCLLGEWEYWSEGDPDCSPSENDAAQCDLSKGGRWIFSTGNDPITTPRRVVFKWPCDLNNDPGCDNGPGLDTRLLYPDANRDTYTDYLLIRINADRLFKQGATEQPLAIDIWTPGSGRDTQLTYISPLRIIEGPGGSKFLTTDGTDGIAELTSGKGKNLEFLGTFAMPMTIEVLPVTN